MTYQCSRHLLLPPPIRETHTRTTTRTRGQPIDVLLATSDHFGHGVFAMVQRVLNQVHMARRLRLEPAVYLGERTFMEPQACEFGVNPYHFAPAGDNVWEYWFEQPGNYSLGVAHVRGRPVRTLQVTVVEGVAEWPIRSYGSLEARATSRVAAHSLLGAGGERLVRRAIREDAARTFAKWRARSKHILGVHLRGTDKVVRPKVPPEAYFPLIDAYLAAHPEALVFVATDDRSYMLRLGVRYGYADGEPGASGGGWSRDAKDGGTGKGRGRRGHIVFRSAGYLTAEWGGKADAVSVREQYLRGVRGARSSDGYTKGLQVQQRASPILMRDAHSCSTLVTPLPLPHNHVAMRAC